MHINLQNNLNRVLVEVVGPNPVSPESAQLLEHQLTQQLGSPLELNLWYRNEFVVNAAGYTTYEELSDSDLVVRSHMLREVFQSNVATPAPPSR